MSRLTLIVPGWPSVLALYPAESVPHDGLAWLLGRGRPCRDSAISCERLLARFLGYAHLPEFLPLAALRRLGEDDGHNVGTGAHWLCADPVNVSFMGGNLLPDSFSWDEIDAAEASALEAALNENFASIGQFSAVTPSRWYLRLAHPAKVRFFSLNEALFRPMQDFLPVRGDESVDAENEARHWHQALNEIQVMLHNHPVNAARSAAGRRPINSLWFWGNGEQIRHGASGLRIGVQTNDSVARGLARMAGIEPESPNVISALRTDTVAVLDTFAAPAQHFDSLAYQTAWTALEKDWFAPIAQRVKEGSLRHFSLHIPGEDACFSLTLGAGARWRFWRKPVSLEGVSDVILGRGD
ncbi:MAG: hypothetical protein LBG78_00420 [Azoarcus sp.]|jgi:hypothetical protein|nr:hypothetical protein [Azoarcus sp.]